MRGIPLETSEVVTAPPPDFRGERLRGGLRIAGEVLITLGLVVLLFVFYAVYVTDWTSARSQAAASDRLRAQWERPAPPTAGPLSLIHI